jgi:uncharacterized protein (TIGR00725 family)
VSGARASRRRRRAVEAGGNVSAERRPVVAVIGNNRASERALAIAEELGTLIVEHGWRLVTGGLSGVMEAASRGAHGSRRYREGDVIGILPGGEASAANQWVDIAVPTSMGYARNVLVVSMADAVVAVGGGAGTLTEMAMAWQLGKLVIGVDVEGWSGRLAGQAIDENRPDRVLSARDAAHAVERLSLVLGSS